MTDVTIQNDVDYLFLQWLGMNYNFWNVLFADIVLFVAIICVNLLLIGLICICIKGMWK